MEVANGELTIYSMGLLINSFRLWPKNVPNKQIMEIYKLRLSYAVYTKKRNGILWNCYWRRLILMVTAYSIIRKNQKIVKKNSDRRRQVHLPRRLRVEKERSKHNSNLTIRIMIKKLSSFSLKCLMNAFRTNMNHLSDFTWRTKLSTALCLTKHSGI